MISNIQKELYKKRDLKYGAFQSALIPTVDKKRIIGVRTPLLKSIAKDMMKKVEDTHQGKKAQQNQVEKFLKELPHKYFDEMQLHAFLLNEIKDYDRCIKEVERFLPYIDNWATCDQLSPKVFKKNKKNLLKYIAKWLKSKKAYVVRFGIGMLMQHFLDEDFDAKYLDMVAKVKWRPKSFSIKQASKKNLMKKNIQISSENDPDLYYVEMMRAWYFATALAKRYKETIPYIEKKKLNAWTHNKTIQKAVESYRINERQREKLKKIKITIH